MGYTGAPPTYQSFPIDYLSGDGVRTSFDLSYPASAEGSILVTINNQHVYSNRYQVNNQSLVFIGYTPPAGTNNIEVLYLGLPALSEAVTGVTSVGLSTTLSGITIQNSPVITSGVIQLGGTLGVQSGGTGANVFNNYQLLIGNGSSPVTSLGTVGAAKQALISQGTGIIPSWQSIVNSFSAGSSGLTPSTASTGDIVLAGILNVATGGTGVVNFVNNRILIGNGTAPVAQVSSTGTLGQVLTSQGNNPPIWSTLSVASISAPPTFGITVTNNAGAVTLGGILSIANGGTNNSTITANTLILGNIAGTAYTSLASVGTSGQVLTSGGPGVAPSWQNISGASVTSFSAGTTGLTPGSASTGAIVLSGILNVASGGTGNTTVVANAILIGNTIASAFTQLASLGTAGQVLTSAGPLLPPTWQTAAAGVSSFSAGTTGLTPSTATTGAITLGGTLNVANGGTGAVTLTANALLLGNGTNAVTQVAGLGTTGQILTSNGPGVAPTWQAIPSSQVWTNATTPPIGALLLAVYQINSVAVTNPNAGSTYVTDGTAAGTRLVNGGTSVLAAGTYLCLGSFVNSANSLWMRIT